VYAKVLGCLNRGREPTPGEPPDDRTVTVVRFENRAAWQLLSREAEEAPELAMAAA
jgi:hypothetical protein